MTCVCTTDADEVESPPSLMSQLSLLRFVREHGQINGQTNLESITSNRNGRAGEGGRQVEQDGILGVV